MRSTSISRPSAISTTALERARGDQRKRRERHPFRLPAADRALVLLHLCVRGSWRPDWARSSRPKARSLRRPDCACAAASKSRRGPARQARTPRRPRLCISSATSRAILPQVPARIASAAATSARRSRWRVPGRVGQRQVEQRREPLGHAEAALAERRERAGGAAELQHQRFLAQPPQPLARARQRRGIARELEPERHRQRLLQQGARHGQRCGGGGRRAR